MARYMISDTIKISSRGQIVIPKSIRDFLHSEYVRFETKGQEVIMHPIGSVKGALKKYASKDNSPSNFEEERKLAWTRSHESQ